MKIITEALIKNDKLRLVLHEPDSNFDKTYYQVSCVSVDFVTGTETDVPLSKQSFETLEEAKTDFLEKLERIALSSMISFNEKMIMISEQLGIEK